MRFMRRNMGYTLIELLIIIGILAAVALPMYLAQRNREKDAVLKGGRHNSQLGLASCAVDNVDVYPAAVADRTALVDSGGRGFTLASHMSDGDFVVP